jgi:hypothetical protein
MPVRRNVELWLAFISILIFSSVYALVVLITGEIPAAREFFGHSLGIIGFTMMLMTETMYSWRKRSRTARLGKMAHWLRFHIYTGIVGPFLVLLHSSWKFNGLAGFVMLLTITIVISGFIGRYIYTSIPRTVDGVEMERDQLVQQIGRLEQSIKSWLASQPAEVQQMGVRLTNLPSQPQAGVLVVLARPLVDWSFRYRLWLEKQKINSDYRTTILEIEALIKRQRQIHRQVSALAYSRRLLSLWHTVHVPLGITLFTTAIIHILAAIYYATLLR